MKIESKLPSRSDPTLPIPLLLRADGQTALVADGRIVAVDPPPESIPAGVHVLAGTAGSTIELGRVNAHTHIYSGLAPFGMPAPEQEPQSFVEILERVWWRLDRALDAESLRASARVYIAEALLAGTTTLVDHHESPAFIEQSLDVLADAAGALGMRALLCFGATERNGGADEGRRGLDECARFIRKNRRHHLAGAIALHASFTVSDECAKRAGELCGELDAIQHVHLAEDAADVEDAKRRGYDGPLERLLELGALPHGSIIAHGVHLSAEQVRRASDAGLWIVQNPRSNRGNKVGYPAALGECERVALGTDGYPADMLAECAALEEIAQQHGDAAYGSRLDNGHTLAGALFGGNFELAPGAVADLGVFEGDRPRHLVMNGRVVVENGVLASGNIDKIRDEARAQAERLWRRMAQLA